MDKTLLTTRPKLDSAALVLSVYPLLRLLVQPFNYYVACFLEAAALLLLILISYRLFSEPRAASNDTKLTRKTAKVNLPMVWHAVIKIYLLLFGVESWWRLFKTQRPINQNKGTCNGICTNAEALKKQNCTEAAPRIRFVGHDAVGLLLQKPASYQFFVNELWWSQIIVHEHREMVFIYGLMENTIYQVRAVHVDLEHQMSFTICTSSLAHVERSPLHDLGDMENLNHSSVSNLTNNTTGALLPRPRRKIDIHDESLKSITEVLDSMRSKAKKLKKERLKKLSALHADIEALDKKLAAKKKSDERTSKRIHALKERVAQHRAELETLTKSVDSRVYPEVDELCRRVEGIQRDSTAKEQQYKVSVQVWAELQRSKQLEIDKLEQRCMKLNDRINKIEKDSEERSGTARKLVNEYLRLLKEERNARKTRRDRLESDFMSAIDKLNAS